MQYTEFMEKTRKSVSDYLGKDVSVEIKEVTKNNGVILQGLVINSKEESLSPTIYLNGFYEDLKDGRPFSDIVCAIADIYQDNRIAGKINLDFFADYNAVKGRIFIKVINYEKNKKLLENLPCKRFLDLAVVCYYAYMNDFLGKGSIQIEIDHLDKWGISEETLFQDAERNTAMNLGAEIKGMDEVIKDMLRENFGGEAGKLAEMAEQARQEAPMYIMTLKGRYFGAACIYNRELLQSFAAVHNTNFYILPSSIHELILLPDDGREEVKALKSMVEEVNADHVAPEEQLSNNVYYFDRFDSKVSLFEKY